MDRQPLVYNDPVVTATVRFSPDGDNQVHFKINFGEYCHDTYAIAQETGRFDFADTHEAVLELKLTGLDLVKREEDG